MSTLTIPFEAESYRIVEERDELTNPVMASWNAVAGSFGVRCGGENGWPDGPSILQKALDNVAKLPEHLRLTFKEGLEVYRACKDIPLPHACELTDEICKTSSFLNFDHYN